MAAFEFFVQKYLIQISILGNNVYELRKTKDIFVISTFKVNYLVPLVFFDCLLVGTKNGAC